MELEINTKIGQFRILEPLGSGGANDVFLAEDEGGARAVLKILAAPERNQGLFDPRIADEVSTYATLQHPNIIKVVDLFSTEGQFVIALEWVDGAPLGVVRAALRNHDSALGDFAILYVAAAMFSALAAAHEAFDRVGRPAPVVHRNVNPSNVHILWDGTVKVGNFNVANVVTVLRDSSPGITWGSYGYFAPEQVKQQPVGPAADVYAATLVLWELLAGRKAIDRGTMSDGEVLAAMASPKIPLLQTVRTDLDRRLVDAVRTGLELDPSRRTLTAAGMRDLLVGLVDMGTERTRLAKLLEPVRTSIARPRQPSKPLVASAKLPPPRPVAKSIPPVQAAPARLSQPEPNPFKAPVVSLPAPPPAPPLPPSPPPATPAAMKTTLMGIVAPPAPPLPPPVFVPAAEAPLTVPVPVSPPPTSREVPEPPAPLPAADAAEPVVARRRSGLPVLVAAGGVIAVALTGVVLFARSGSPISANVIVAPASAAPASSPAPVLLPQSVTATAAMSAPAASTMPEVPAHVATEAPSAAIRQDQGQLVFPPSAAGHRIFVDGRVVGDGAQPAVVRCGAHDVKVGSAGTTQRVDVPCGGSITLMR